MERSRRALVAGVDGSSRERLIAAARGAGFEPAEAVRDGTEALARLRDARPELLLADAVLPGLDGAGLARAVLELPLSLHPAVVLAAPRGLALPDEAALASLNAARVDAPCRSEDVARAFGEILRRPPPLPGALAVRLDGLLDELGVPAHPGRDALRAAVALAWLDRRRLRGLKAGLYPRAAELAGLTPAQTERAMRYAIDAAWRSSALESQNRIFGDTIDARRGRPTCGEMIAQLADILRWEGRK